MENLGRIKFYDSGDSLGSGDVNEGLVISYCKVSGRLTVICDTGITSKVSGARNCFGKMCK